MIRAASYHPADLQLTPELDHALLATPKDEPELAETYQLWLFDGERNTGFNIQARAAGGQFDAVVTVFLPDGRIARANFGRPGPFTEADAPHNAHVYLKCEEPFRRWRVQVRDIPVWMGSDAQQAAGVAEDMTPTTTISLEAVIAMTSPPVINGGLLPESRQTLDTVAWVLGNRLTSGYSPRAYRYHQLVEGEGKVVFEGRRLPVSGAGLRAHMRGVRRTEGTDTQNNCWAEAWSRAGKRGFGVMLYTRPGGGFKHSEGYLFQDGRIHPARVLWHPPLERDPEKHESIFELACDELGLVRITARDERAFWWRMPGVWGQSGGAMGFGFDPNAPMLMQQTIGRFTWEDGVVGYGILQRSG